MGNAHSAFHRSEMCVARRRPTGGIEMPEVKGAIRDRWLELGGAASFLGNPVTDELPFPPEKGRVSFFEHGAIYWWEDVNGGRATDIGEMFVHYQGLNCFGTTDGPGADEPYVTIGVSVPNQPPATFRTPIFEGVEDGHSRPHQMLLYRGQPRGMTIVAQLIEHDSGNPDNYRDRMRVIVGAVSGAITPLLILVPVVGPVLAPTVGTILATLNPVIAEEVGELIGLGDDLIDSPWTIALTPKDMVVMAAHQPNSVEKDVAFKVQPGQPVPLLEGHGGSYKVYFGMSKAP
jgi:hypothetical protein